MRRLERPQTGTARARGDDSTGSAVLRFYAQVLAAPARLRAGTHRAASLAAPWKRFAPAMRRAGITRIADLTGLAALGVPVAAANRPLGKSLATQQGKGLTLAAARVSAQKESRETRLAEVLSMPRIRES